jgi:hypothetical protein
MNISDAAKLTNMATDMLLVAIRDLKRGETTLESALWFVGPDFGYWAELANIPFVEPLQIFRAQLNPARALALMARIRRVLHGYESLPEDSGYTRGDVRRLAIIVSETLTEIGFQETHKKRLGTFWRQVTGEVRNVNNRFIRIT